MSEHLSSRNIERYLLRALTPEELLRADDHLASCADCRARAAEGAQAGQTFASLYGRLQEAARGEDAHLAYEQIAALVDGGLGADERGGVEHHLASCPACAAAADDLRAFAAALSVARRQQREPNRTLKKKVGDFWLFVSSPRRFALTAATAFAVALVLFALSAPLFLLLRTRTGPRQVARSQPPPAASVSPAPPAATPSGSTRRDGNTTNEQTHQPPLVASRPAATPEASEAGGSSAVVLNDGGVRVVLNRRGRVEGLEGLPAASQREVGLALAAGRLELPTVLAQLRGKPGVLMGGGKLDTPFALLDPVGVVVRSERPTLRWKPLEGATQYTVTVFDPDFNAVVKSPPLKQTAWEVPAALERGRVYEWQVTALKDGREVIAPQAPAPEARFEVLGREQEEELARVERVRPNSHLTRGVVYAHVGLLEDAEREFRALVRDNPSSRGARRLLAEVRALRRAK